MTKGWFPKKSSPTSPANQSLMYSSNKFLCKTLTRKDTIVIVKTSQSIT